MSCTYLSLYKLYEITSLLTLKFSLLPISTTTQNKPTKLTFIYIQYGGKQRHHGLMEGLDGLLLSSRYAHLRFRGSGPCATPRMQATFMSLGQLIYFPVAEKGS
jgi:hypothetical protein